MNSPNVVEESFLVGHPVITATVLPDGIVPQTVFEAGVREFHETFKHPIAQGITPPDEALANLRIKLIASELREYAHAVGFNFEYTFSPNAEKSVNMIEAADALGDIEYVTQGASLVHGIPHERVFKEIQYSNMTKLGADGKPIYNAAGKVQKGPNYRLPNIKAAIYGVQSYRYFDSQGVEHSGVVCSNTTTETTEVEYTLNKVVATPKGWAIGTILAIFSNVKQDGSVEVRDASTQVNVCFGTIPENQTPSFFKPYMLFSGYVLNETIEGV